MAVDHFAGSQDLCHQAQAPDDVKSIAMMRTFCWWALAAWSTGRTWKPTALSSELSPAEPAQSSTQTSSEMETEFLSFCTFADSWVETFSAQEFWRLSVGLISVGKEAED